MEVFGGIHFSAFCPNGRPDFTETLKFLPVISPNPPIFGGAGLPMVRLGQKCSLPHFRGCFSFPEVPHVLNQWVTLTFTFGIKSGGPARNRKDFRTSYNWLLQDKANDLFPFFFSPQVPGLSLSTFLCFPSSYFHVPPPLALFVVKVPLFKETV